MQCSFERPSLSRSWERRGDRVSHRGEKDRVFQVLEARHCQSQTSPLSSAATQGKIPVERKRRRARPALTVSAACLLEAGRTADCPLRARKVRFSVRQNVSQAVVKGGVLTVVGRAIFETGLQLVDMGDEWLGVRGL